MRTNVSTLYTIYIHIHTANNGGTGANDSKYPHSDRSGGQSPSNYNASRRASRNSGSEYNHYDYVESDDDPG